MKLVLHTEQGFINLVKHTVGKQTYSVLANLDNHGTAVFVNHATLDSLLSEMNESSISEHLKTTIHAMVKAFKEISE